MIESISISNTATFSNTPVVLQSLSTINFLFGSNGSGKTTISRVIANQEAFPESRIAWQAGTPKQSMVYNSDFIERNFYQSSVLKGVFTLGEKNLDLNARIARTKDELDVITSKLNSLTTTLEGQDGLGGKQGELKALDSRTKEKIWAQKQKHDEALRGGFEGYRNSSDKFKEKVLSERSLNNASILSLDQLSLKATEIFAKRPTAEPLVPEVDLSVLEEHESDPILKKRVIGKDDVDIAAMIKKLGNSDWVRAGVAFYEINNHTCPFCQQEVDVAFGKSLTEYFDEAFEADSKEIDRLATNYVTDSERIQLQIDSIITTASRFLNVEAIEMEKDLLDAKIDLNVQLIGNKKKEANHAVELHSIKNISATIVNHIDAANEKIKSHNQVVSNLDFERSTLTDQIWKFVLNELASDLTDYDNIRTSIEKAIKAVTKQIESTRTEYQNKLLELQELERQTTSIQPTIDGINTILKSLGFIGFRLAAAEDGVSYKLVRADDSDAKMTLSEGERTFITFLYFYFLLKGSEHETGVTVDRVVVFDDPVSSLDSDILFVVSSLIKQLFDDVRSSLGHVKQVFVFTHNVYFHKEVSFNPRRQSVALSDETFWVIRKPDQVSMIERHTTNPIKTSYELMWTEVRRSDRSKLTIQNTLRRILESYFTILGGMDKDDICLKFEGKEQTICRSLFSWVNDGSHGALDDIYVSIQDSAVEIYLFVFKEIFRRSGHFSHYRMMMGDTFLEGEPGASLENMAAATKEIETA